MKNSTTVNTMPEIIVPMMESSGLFMQGLPQALIDIVDKIDQPLIIKDAE
jgi:hypothetical protein